MDQHTLELVLMGLVLPAGGFVMKLLLKGAEETIRKMAADVQAAVAIITRHGTDIELSKQRLEGLEARLMSIHERSHETINAIQRLELRLSALEQLAERRRAPK